MNREIVILRETVVKLTQLLTNMGLKVTQQGTQAFVEVDPRNQKPRRINIPHIPDNATKELILAIQGFIDHEVGHVLFTDWSVVKRAYGRGENFKSLHNIVEDPFVERKMGERFPGAVYNVKQLHGYFIEEITKPALAQVKGDLAKEFSVLLVPLVRALSGQQIFKDFIKDYESHPLVKELLARLPADLKTRMPKLQSSEDTFKVAQVIFDIIHPPKKPSPPPPPIPSKSSEKSESKEKDDEKSESKEKSEKDGDDEEQESSANEDEGEADVGEEDEDDGKDEGDADESEDGAGSEAGEAQDDDADGSDGDGEEGDEDDGAEGSGDSDSDEDGDDQTGDDEGEANEDENGSSEGDADADDGSAAGSSSDSEGEDDDQPELKDGDEDQNGKGAPPDSPFAALGIPACPDFDGSLGEKISREARNAAKESDYLIFSRDFDRIEPYPSNGVDVELIRLDDSTRHMVGLMQKDIERMMAARSQVLNVPGFRSGRLHSSGLHKLMAGDDRIFRRRHEAKSKDTVVGLLIDNSGSMTYSDKISVAMSCGYALSQTLERVGIKHEVLGFTTDDYAKGLSSRVIHDEEIKIGRSFSRIEPLYVPIYKSMEERLTPEIRRRFAGAAYRHTGMRNNVDGESVEIAVMRLARRSERRKVLMVLSDGRPHAAGNGREQERKLKEVVRDAPKMGVDLIGIGIMDDSVRAYYPRHVVLPTLADLPRTIMGEVKSILMAA